MCLLERKHFLINLLSDNKVATCKRGICIRRLNFRVIGASLHLGGSIYIITLLSILEINRSLSIWWNNKSQNWFCYRVLLALASISIWSVYLSSRELTRWYTEIQVLQVAPRDTPRLHIKCPTQNLENMQKKKKTLLDLHYCSTVPVWAQRS